MSITETRRALAATLDELDLDVKAIPATGDILESTQQYVVRVLVGPPSDETEEALDELISLDGPRSVRALLEQYPSAVVIKCSGYRIYPSQDGDLLGAEWTVQTLT